MLQWFDRENTRKMRTFLPRHFSEPGTNPYGELYNFLPKNWFINPAVFILAPVFVLSRVGPILQPPKQQKTMHLILYWIPGEQVTLTKTNTLWITDAIVLRKQEDRRPPTQETRIDTFERWEGRECLQGKTFKQSAKWIGYVPSRNNLFLHLSNQNQLGVNS